MNTESIEALEAKTHKILRVATFSQCCAIFIAGIILYCKPPHYSEMGQCFSLVALLGSFAVSRWFIANGKKIEALKTFSDEEGQFIYKQYFFKLFSPYAFWVICLFLFKG